MAATSDRRFAAGGKIVKNRRVPAALRTPYARPVNSQVERGLIEKPENPNWLSGLIYPAKMIASGAGKFLSFFGSESCSSDADSSECDGDEEEIANDVSSQRNDGSQKVLSVSGKSDNLRAIEQLVMQETFSREEGNELIKLIKSRVVDTNGTLDESASNMRTTAIIEARKWLQRKRSGSKKNELELDISTLATPTKVAETGKDSPVDMAKSYMQNRPAWASSSLKHVESGSPPPLGVLNYKEETPKSVVFSSEMKRGSMSSGSWNILEEIRRVRSKATEELLATKSLTKNSPSFFSPESNQPQDSLMIDGEVERAAIAVSVHDTPQNVTPVSPYSRAGQDDKAVLTMEHQELQETADLKADEDSKVDELRSTAVENGFPSTASGSSGGGDATQKSEPPEELNANLVSSDLPGTDVNMEGAGDLNPEPKPTSAVEASNANLETVVNCSHDSSSMQVEDTSQEHSQPTVAHTPKARGKGKGKGKVKAHLPEERKLRGNTRRSRGRG